VHHTCNPDPTSDLTHLPHAQTPQLYKNPSDRKITSPTFATSAGRPNSFTSPTFATSVLTRGPDYQEHQIHQTVRQKVPFKEHGPPGICQKSPPEPTINFLTIGGYN